MHCWTGNMHNMVYKSKKNEKNASRFYNKEHWTLLKNSNGKQNSNRKVTRKLTTGRVTRRPTFICCSKMIWIHSDSSGSKRYLHYMVWWQCVIMWTGYVSTVTSLAAATYESDQGLIFFFFFDQICAVQTVFIRSDLGLHTGKKKQIWATFSCSLNVALNWYCCWQVYST